MARESVCLTAAARINRPPNAIPHTQQPLPTAASKQTKTPSRAPHGSISIAPAFINRSKEGGGDCLRVQPLSKRAPLPVGPDLLPAACLSVCLRRMMRVGCLPFAKTGAASPNSTQFPLASSFIKIGNTWKGHLETGPRQDHARDARDVHQSVEMAQWLRPKPKPRSRSRDAETPPRSRTTLAAGTKERKKERTFLGGLVA
jgi:hypothetical protein